jgi:hypothetical protein
MNDLERTEVESLKQQLAQARRELKLTALGFTFGAWLAGFALRWYLRDQQTVGTAMLLAVSIGAVLFGGIFSSAYVFVSRLRGLAPSK